MKQKPRHFFGWMSRKIGGKLGIGIITVVPFAVTIWIIYEIFIRVDGLLQPAIRTIWGINVPGAGFAATLILIFLIGIFASNVIGRRIIHYGESLIPGFPIFSQIYTGVKQILESFSPPPGTRRFQTAIIEFPRKGMKAMGFITNEVTDACGKKWLFVLIPNAPNPTAGGFMEIVEECDVIRTDISMENTFKTIFSAGKVIPPEVADILFGDGIPEIKEPAPEDEAHPLSTGGDRKKDE